MKKFILIALLLAVGIAFAAQNSAITIRQVRDPVQLRAVLNSNSADVTSGRTAQKDVTTNTTTTAYTPRQIGDWLIGYYHGAGTNGVWIAKGVTTNDWVLIIP